MLEAGRKLRTTSAAVVNHAHSQAVQQVGEDVLGVQQRIRPVHAHSAPAPSFQLALLRGVAAGQRGAVEGGSGTNAAAARLPRHFRSAATQLHRGRLQQPNSPHARGPTATQSAASKRKPKPTHQHPRRAATHARPHLFSRRQLHHLDVWHELEQLN